jgi:putative transcriptional regulator
MRDYVENKVQVLRKAKPLTQEELAEAVGVTRQTIIAIEKGNYVPSVALALKLAHVLQEPVEHIFNVKQ